MSVSVTMPQLGESVTEGTVTRWLKKEGDRVEQDEPLLEISTDKVDTEIPSPAAGILRSIAVAEDETVAVGAQLATIEDEAGAAGRAPAPAEPQAPGAQADGAGAAPAAEAAEPAEDTQPSAEAQGSTEAQVSAEIQSPQAQQSQEAPASQEAPRSQETQPGQEAQDQAEQPRQEAQRTRDDQLAGLAGLAGLAEPRSQSAVQGTPPYQQGTSPYQQGSQPYQERSQSYQEGTQSYQQGTQSYQEGTQPYQQGTQSYEQGTQPYQGGSQPYQQAAPPPSWEVPWRAEAPQPAEPVAGGPPRAGQAGPPEALPVQPPSPAEQAAAAPPAAGQDEDETADQQSGQEGTAAPGPDGPYVTPLVRKLAAEHGVALADLAGTGVGGRIRKQDVLDAARARRDAAAAAQQDQAATAPGPVSAQPASQAGPGEAPRRDVVPSTLRGSTEQMSRLRQVIAQRMVESLRTSAQLTTVAEADVTEIARLRNRARTKFEAREGVRLSFLPFFALATIEALKVHPHLNASLDSQTGQITYHEAEHLGIAVDTDRGLLVPVIRNAGDLNIGGLARKIADLAQRTRAGQVTPDELAGGTFTLTNTGSRGALFDTPIINQPQVAILGTGTVVKRAVVVEDPELGEVIAVRSMVYLALTYDHRLIDGADAARFLSTVRGRLEEGDFESELGL